MPNIIRADTDQLRAVARQMRATADLITNGTNGMRQSMDVLDATWSGQARDRGMARWAEMTPKYPPAVERLVHVANELEALAQRLDDAAAVFGGGGGAGGTGSTGGTDTKEDKHWYAADGAANAPDNMAKLFDELGKDDNEIQIYQVGPNEFAVLLQGSDQSLVGINSLLLDAPQAGLGGDTEYAQKVRSMLQDLAAKYPSAAINMVGYSLGGIISQQVASDRTFFAANGLNLKSVSTYGSPKVGNVPGGKTYANFDAPGDIVSGLPVSLTPESLLTTTAFLMKPLETGIVGITQHMTGYQDLPDWMPVSETRQNMLDTKPPFDTKTWVRVDEYNDAITYGSKADEFLGNTIGSDIANGLTQAGQYVVEQYNNATEHIGNAVETVIDAGQNVFNETVEGIGNFIQNPPWPFG